MEQRLQGQRVLVNQAHNCMGADTIALSEGLEDALFALFLASDESGFFVGQSFPFAGGWKQ